MQKFIFNPIETVFIDDVGMEAKVKQLTRSTFEFYFYSFDDYLYIDSLYSKKEVILIIRKGILESYVIKNVSVTFDQVTEFIEIKVTFLMGIEKLIIKEGDFNL